MMFNSSISNGLVTLRKWERGDAQALADIGNNINISYNMADGFHNPCTLKRAKQYIEKAIDNNVNILYAIIFMNNLAGSIGAFQQNGIYRANVSIAYFIGEPYWNNGIASKAISLISKEIFENNGIERIYAEPFERNIGSRKALEKSGYKLEAIIKRNVIKNEEIINSCIYSVLREEFVLTTG